MSKAVDFYFDVGSPASYLAATQLPRLCKEAGAQLNYKPMLLGGVFQATGNASPAAIPAKGRYTFDDLARHADRYGVRFHRNPHFPINTLMLMRGAVGMQRDRPEHFVAYLDAVFNAIWIDGENMNDAMVVARTLEAAGLAADRVMALVNDSTVKEALKQNTTEAVARGVFGAPTMFVGSEMFFGQDRLEFVRQALE